MLALRRGQVEQRRAGLAGVTLRTSGARRRSRRLREPYRQRPAVRFSPVERRGDVAETLVAKALGGSLSASLVMMTILVFAMRSSLRMLPMMSSGRRDRRSTSLMTTTSIVRVVRSDVRMPLQRRCVGNRSMPDTAPFTLAIAI